MDNIKIRRKTKSRRSIMRTVRSSNSKRKRSCSSISNTSNAEQIENFLDSYSIIHTKSLISLLKQFKCCQCNNLWNGSVLIKERNGLYVQFEFRCSSCEFSTRLYSSSTLPNSKRHDINVRLALGGTLCGLGRDGIGKLLGALNLPPPVQEHKYRATQEFILDYVEKAKHKSMVAAIEAAIDEGGGARDITVSGDGAWLTRGYSSIHGVAALCTATKRPKVIDTSWSSKKCAKCQGAESLRHLDPGLFAYFQQNHECQLNYTGSSGGMEKEMIHEMFSRSCLKYNVIYSSYIGDGDAKVHKHLTNNPPYSNICIKKLEDTNHFAKRMFNRIMKIKKENKGVLLSDGKRFNGKGRFTDALAIKFKIYFAKAIRSSKNDLNELYKKSWAIFRHHYSTNEQPMHDWCDGQWCKYIQATSNGQEYNHNSKSTIPRPCLDLIKPVFEELCSYNSLERVVNGGSQNANESLHAMLWTMVPKHRYCSSTVLRIALGLTTIIYNDGYDNLYKIFISMLASMGYYSGQCFRRLSEQSKYNRLKVQKRFAKKAKTTMVSGADISSSESGDELLFSMDSTNNDSLNICNGLMDLEILNDSVISDYEPGGDD